MLLELSSGNKAGLAIVAAVFIVFALVSAFVLPRRWGDYPGRGLPAFIILSFLLFIGMLTAVEVFGKEKEEARAENVETSAAPGANEQPSETQPATTAPGAAARVIRVRGTEYKLALPSKTLSQGKYEFELRNAGKEPHNLTISGPRVNNAATPTIGPGKTARIQATLVEGTYKLYCSVPGHEEAGMRVELHVD